MKLLFKSKYLLPVFVLPLLLLTACFSPYKGDTATLKLVLGSAAAPGRDISDTTPDNVISMRLVHTIELSGPTGRIMINAPAGQSTVQVEVAPGRWDIAVEALLDGEPYANGSASADIKAGQNNPVQISMYLVTKGPPLDGSFEMGGDNWIGDGNYLTAYFSPYRPDTGSETEPPTPNYKWWRGDTPVQADPIDPTGRTYAITDADWGYDITVTVTCEGYSGSKTSDPIRIYKAINNGSDFSNIGVISDLPLNGSYILLNDITPNDNLSAPVGTIDAPFTGTFDGNWHTIFINLNDPLPQNIGLFASIGSGGMVKNLKLTGSFNPNSLSAATYNIGAVTGINNGVIQDVSSQLGIYISNTAVSSGTVIIAGGIAGTNNMTIQNCSVTYSSVSAGLANEVDAGGIAGSSSGTIQNCYTICDVSANAMGTGTTFTAGGIVGMMNGGTVSYCWTGGSINSFNYNDSAPNIVGAGGIAGYGSGTINSCVALNYSTIATSTDNTIGRIWGQGNNVKASNNFGRSDINSDPGFTLAWPNAYPTGQDGADVDINTAMTSDWWINTAGWVIDVYGNNADDTQPWKWNDGTNDPYGTDSPSYCLPVLWFELQ